MFYNFNAHKKQLPQDDQPITNSGESAGNFLKKLKRATADFLGAQFGRLSVSWQKIWLLTVLTLCVCYSSYLIYETLQPGRSGIRDADYLKRKAAFERYLDSLQKEIVKDSILYYHP